MLKDDTDLFERWKTRFEICLKDLLLTPLVPVDLVFVPIQRFVLSLLQTFPLLLLRPGRYEQVKHTGQAKGHIKGQLTRQQAVVFNEE